MGDGTVRTVYAEMARPVDLLDLDPSARRLHSAVHEAGHAVVGIAVGLPLLEVTIHEPTPWEQESDALLLGGTRFEAPNGDQHELARQRPDEVAVMAMSGSEAEQALLGRYGTGGFAGDVRMVRIGFGWLRPMSTDQQSCLHAYRDQAKALVGLHRNAIESVANALVEVGRLSRADLTAILPHLG
jgi:hypothetical protein